MLSKSSRLARRDEGGRPYSNSQQDMKNPHRGQTILQRRDSRCVEHTGQTWATRSARKVEFSPARVSSLTELRSSRGRFKTPAYRQLDHRQLQTELKTADG